MRTATTIKLSALAPSPQNVRKRQDKAGIESLAASIEAHGLLYPLLVRPNGKGFKVEEGGRRFAALQLLAKRGAIRADHGVACITLDKTSDADALEIGLIANVARADLHPAEEVKAFAELAAAGASPADIAARFGIPERRVRQRLALGGLSPVILAAWRDGNLGRSAAASAEAFTLASSRAEQERVFKQLAEEGWIVPGAIRQKLGAGDHDVSRLYAFVGKAAYEAAGGKVIEDLFGDNSRVSDVKLLEAAAVAKLAATAAELVADGWSWAAPADELTGYQPWLWRTLPSEPKPTKAEKARLAQLAAIIEAAEENDYSDDAIDDAEAEGERLEATIAARSYDAAARKKSGCVLSIDHEGALSIRYGVVKPTAAKTTKGAPDKSDKPKKPVVSGALMHRVSLVATAAARVALVEEPRLALAALIAGLNTVDHQSPIKLRISDNVWSPDKVYDERRHEPTRFAAELKRLAALDDAALLREAAIAAASALDMQAHGERPPLGDGYNAALADALDGERLNKTLRDRFDAADYFKSVSGETIKQALQEAHGPRYSNFGNMNRKKGELVELAVKTVPATGWLPPALRTAHYDGPGAAKKATPPKKATPKKQAAAKRRKAPPAKKRTAKKGK